MKSSSKFLIKCGTGWYYLEPKNAWGINEETATVYSEEDLPIELPHPLVDGECTLDNCAIGRKHIWLDCINQVIAIAERV